MRDTSGQLAQQYREVTPQLGERPRKGVSLEAGSERVEIHATRLLEITLVSLLAHGS